MRHEFVSRRPEPIASGAPDVVESRIAVSGLAGAAVTDIEVAVDIRHSWTADLEIALVAPDGREVALATRRGGERDDFRGTLFRDDAATPIGAGRAPFRGSFRPEGSLAELRGEAAEGVWTLRVEDRAHGDGGTLESWRLGFDTDAVETSAFSVEVRFLGGLSAAQRRAFASAAARWSEVIVGDVPPVVIEGERIDDVVIEAQGVAIDGPGGTLGQAGPRFVRPGSLLPAKGVMSFDTADLARMESDGSLEDVILHEMAHVLGFGTVWGEGFLELLVGAGAENPTFVGANAMREYGRLLAAAGRATDDAPTPVPVANTGGAGTRDGHWREAVFGDELLTGFLSGATRPLSRLSIGCFEDMGYRVGYAAADAYLLPSAARIAELGARALRRAIEICSVKPIVPTVLPPEAVVNAA